MSEQRGGPPPKGREPRDKGPAQVVEGQPGGEPVSMEGTEGGQPVLVQFEDDDGPPRRARLVTKGEGLTLEPETTEEADRVTKEQRRISAIWEVTQAVISITVTVSVIYCQITDIQSETLNNAFFFVIATYLQRTNHTRVGGSGRKAYESPYLGR